MKKKHWYLIILLTLVMNLFSLPSAVSADDRAVFVTQPCGIDDFFPVSVNAEPELDWKSMPRDFYISCEGTTADNACNGPFASMFSTQISFKCNTSASISVYNSKNPGYNTRIRKNADNSYTIMISEKSNTWGSGTVPVDKPLPENLLGAYYFEDGKEMVAMYGSLEKCIQELGVEKCAPDKYYFITEEEYKASKNRD